jgi:N-acetylmuramoyl-L-alanine amidase
MLTPEVDTVARTAWGEARGCGLSGMMAVINVIYNRAKHPIHWADQAAEVCLEPSQFSCWNAADPNKPLLSRVTSADPQFKQAVDLAARAAAGKLGDITGGADSYYARSLKTPPYWAVNAARTYTDKCHYYLRTAAPPAPAISTSAADALNALELAKLRGENS